MNKTQEKSIEQKKKFLHAASVLFLKNGFTYTKIEDISRSLGYTNNNFFFRSFSNKEAILLELMPYVLNQQLTLASKFVPNHIDNIMLYSLNIAIEFYVSESSESLRNLYISSYSIVEVADLIYKTMAPKLKMIFGDYFKEYEEKDFYELDIATSSIVRGYMTVKCDMYFTVKEKIRKCLEAILRIFKINEERISEIIEYVLKMDIENKIGEAINEMINKIEGGGKI